jgi:SAM-dependent methyltransferase
VILNLGAGDKIMAGAVNHDLISHRPEIDVAWDLNERPWPWGGDAFQQIIAVSVLEHLKLNLVETMDECWRILRPGGRMVIKVPFWQHDNAYADPTHYWRFSLRSFDVLDPKTKLGAQHHFYTARKWRIVAPPKLNQVKSSLRVTLAVRK